MTILIIFLIGISLRLEMQPFFFIEVGHCNLFLLMFLGFKDEGF